MTFLTCFAYMSVAQIIYSFLFNSHGYINFLLIEHSYSEESIVQNAICRWLRIFPPTQTCLCCTVRTWWNSVSVIFLFSVHSSGQVTSTQEEFKSMSGHIQISKNLLTRYSRREMSDKLLILLALMFFFATVLYIVKKRFFGAYSILEAAQTYTGEVGGGGEGSGHQHTEM